MHGNGKQSARSKQNRLSKPRYEKLTNCAVLGAPFEYFAHEQWRVAARVNISE
jgi:hypothetical protein